MSNESAQTQSAGNSGWFGILMELYRVNEQYIQEVVDSSRRILQTVLEGLVPNGRLKHAPIRTFFRILSGMIFILKVSLPLPISMPIMTMTNFIFRPSLSVHGKTMCESL